jgi:hypothetical protein
MTLLDVLAFLMMIMTFFAILCGLFLLSLLWTLLHTVMRSTLKLNDDETTGLLMTTVILIFLAWAGLQFFGSPVYSWFGG